MTPTDGIVPFSGVWRNGTHDAWPADPRPLPEIRRHLPPAPAVVIAGSALFLCGLVGSVIGLGAYKLVEWVTGRQP